MWLGLGAHSGPLILFGLGHVQAGLASMGCWRQLNHKVNLKYRPNDMFTHVQNMGHVRDISPNAHLCVCPKKGLAL